MEFVGGVAALWQWITREGKEKEEKKEKARRAAYGAQDQESEDKGPILDWSPFLRRPLSSSVDRGLDKSSLQTFP